MILLRGDKLSNKRKAGRRETTMSTEKRDKCIIEHLLDGIPIVILCFHTIGLVIRTVSPAEAVIVFST
jgi:hypothetical protein